MSEYEQYKIKIQTSFNYILNNKADLLDYKYCLGLLFESIYLISEDLIEEIKIVLKQLNVENIYFDPQSIIEHLDIESIETYLYIFSEIKNDINNYNQISDDTKLKMIIVLNRMTDKRYPFMELEDEGDPK